MLSGTKGTIRMYYLYIDKKIFKIPKSETNLLVLDETFFLSPHENMFMGSY